MTQNRVCVCPQPVSILPVASDPTICLLAFGMAESRTTKQGLVPKEPLSFGELAACSQMMLRALLNGQLSDVVNPVIAAAPSNETEQLSTVTSAWVLGMTGCLLKGGDPHHKAPSSRLSNSPTAPSTDHKNYGFELETVGMSTDNAFAYPACPLWPLPKDIDSVRTWGRALFTLLKKLSYHKVLVQATQDLEIAKYVAWLEKTYVKNHDCWLIFAKAGFVAFLTAVGLKAQPYVTILQEPTPRKFAEDK